MIKFVLKRTGYGLLVIFGVILIVFFLFHALPGDPVDVLAGPHANKQTREIIRKELGLDKPLYFQLKRYLNDLSPISVHENTPKEKAKYNYSEIMTFGESVLVFKTPYLRRSFQTNRRVDEIVMESLEGTLWLALAAMTFATIVGIAFGLIAALKQGSYWDYFLISLSVTGISVPSFVAAILVSWTFGYLLADYTGLELTGYLWVTDPYLGKQLQLKNIILPAFTLGIRPLAIITQLTRGAMLEVLGQDYIRTAKAKGLSNMKVVLKHALKNALNPVITAVSGWLASLMAGAFFIEYVFNWRGLGFKTLKAVENLDLPIVMGSTLVVATFFIFINILADVFYAMVDPRVRLS